MSHGLSDRNSFSHLTAARFTRELALLLPASSRSPTPAVRLDIFRSPPYRASPSQQSQSSGLRLFARRTTHCTEIDPSLPRKQVSCQLDSGRCCSSNQKRARLLFEKISFVSDSNPFQRMPTAVEPISSGHTGRRYAWSEGVSRGRVGVEGRRGLRGGGGACRHLRMLEEEKSNVLRLEIPDPEIQMQESPEYRAGNLPKGSLKVSIWFGLHVGSGTTSISDF